MNEVNARVLLLIFFPLFFIKKVIRSAKMRNGELRPKSLFLRHIPKVIHRLSTGYPQVIHRLKVVIVQVIFLTTTKR